MSGTESAPDSQAAVPSIQPGPAPEIKPSPANIPKPGPVPPTAAALPARDTGERRASVPASAAAAPSEGSLSNGVYLPPGVANGDVKPVISTTPLVDFLMQLEDYTPT
ncbi:hypothetical protein XELAEV_18000129mg, partial [Xenopus laevis]